MFKSVYIELEVGAHFMHESLHCLVTMSTSITQNSKLIVLAAQLNFVLANLFDSI